MTHHLDLCHQPFVAIKSGRKVVEMRLFDEKKSKIKVDDTLIFTDLDTKNYNL